MHEALSDLKIWQSSDVVIGIDTYDDAGVYRLDEKTALVQTLDFFTPIVDDPYAFGQIAAANALSDIYAMGGRPVTAMNILCVPVGDLAGEDVNRILQGGADKLKEAKCSLIGGHTVLDKELKFGCSITGLVDPREVWSNAKARVGDRLILTKRLGIGILTSALKQGKLADDGIAEITRSMATLNKSACEAARGVGGVSSATDITGFGFAGHAGMMAKASGVTFRIETAKLPLFPQAIAWAKKGVKTRGDRLNREFLKGHYETAPTVETPIEDVVFDPQTSGGLLLAVSPDKAQALISALKGVNAPAAADVGEVLPRDRDLYLKIR
ncbi:MAG: selenide, water dikinase SelD [Planctomycetes bacterium]|nr:selenide, water dikinase SelD [Planctomycetota bacterium]